MVAEPGKWMPIGSHKSYSVCCDCGLTHRDEYAIEIGFGMGRKPEIRLHSRHWREEAMTAKKRRQKKRKGEKLPGEK